MAIEAIQALAGHRSIASTRIYLHLGGDWLANEYRRAARAIDAQAPGGGGPMSAIAFPAAGGPEPLDQRLRGAQPEITWAEIAQRAPLMSSTMADYLDQLSARRDRAPLPPSRSPCASSPVG